jgi:hypothetical protein
MTSKIDWTEVGRKAHELEVAHGRAGAHRYAAKIAEEALADGDVADYAFWQAVERSFAIR